MTVPSCTSDTSKEDNSSVSTLKKFDILVPIPTLFQNLHGKVENAFIIKRIVNHTCI